MRIRIKDRVAEGTKRIDSNSKIDNVDLTPDIIEGQNDSISIYFKGSESSGILDLTIEETKELAKTFQNLTKIRKKK